MNDIMVSVCVITYNQEKYIRKCLDSIFMQKTNFNFEVIVAEDASPDNTRQILLEYKEKYGDKLVLVLHDENVGVSKNSLSARILTKGKYISSLEGDDFWTDEYKLQKQFDILEANPQYSACSCDYSLVSPEGEIIRHKALNLEKDIVKTMKDWLKDGYSLHTCSTFSRNVFPNTDEKYQKLRTTAPTMGDLISFTLLYDLGDIYVIKDSMAAHREAGKNDTASFSYNQRTKAIKYSHMYYDIIKALEEYLDYRYDFTPRYINRLALVKYEHLRGKIQYKNKDFKPLMDKLNTRQKISVYYRLIKIILKKTSKKIKLLTERKSNV